MSLGVASQELRKDIQYVLTKYLIHSTMLTTTDEIRPYTRTLHGAYTINPPGIQNDFVTPRSCICCTIYLTLTMLDIILPHMDNYGLTPHRQYFNHIMVTFLLVAISYRLDTEKLLCKVIFPFNLQKVRKAE